MAVGEAFAVLASNEGNVVVIGRVGEAEAFDDEALACRTLEEVVAPDDVCDTLACVIHHHSQLIRGEVAFGPDHEVTDDLAGPERPLTGDAIGDHNIPRWDHEPPVARLGLLLESRRELTRSARREEHRFPSAFLRRGRGFARVLKFAAGFGGWVREPACGERLHRRAIRLEIVALHKRPVVPVNSQGPQRPLDPGDGTRLHAGRVEVLDAEQDLPAILTREGPIDEERPGVAQVQRPGGRWGESCNPLRKRRLCRCRGAQGQTVHWMPRARWVGGGWGGDERAKTGSGTEDRMATKLSEDQVSDAIKLVPEWGDTGETIQRTYQFSDFVKAMGFVGKVAAAAEKNQHHPDILIRYNKVTLTLSTHDAGGITIKDFDLAAKCDALFATFGPQAVPARKKKA